MWTEQKGTEGVPERDGRRNSPRTTSATISHASLLVEGSFEQDSTRAVPSPVVRNELI